MLIERPLIYNFLSANETRTERNDLMQQNELPIIIACAKRIIARRHHVTYDSDNNPLFAQRIPLDKM